MGSSSIPACKAELVDLFRADDELADVEIQYGRKANPENEYVCLTGTSEWTRNFANLGPLLQISETFVLDVLVGAYKPSQDQQEATERVFEIFAQVERIVLAHTQYARDDPDSPVLWMQVRSNELFEYPYLEGQVAVIDCGIYFETRI